MKFDLVVFFLPQEKTVNGGIISIFSLCKETRTILGKNTESILCLLPGCESFHENDLFDNDEYIFDIEELIRLAKGHKNALFHVPEYRATQFHHLLSPYLTKLDHLDISVNVLNQNIEYMAEPGELADLFLLSPKVTQTTAHTKYCSQEYSNHYGLPTHLLSVHIDPSNYKFVTYAKKENLIVYSADDQPMKERIVDVLKKELPDYKFREIAGLRFEEYKSLISRAKFAITFGEGFDGYFIESAFAGAVPFAVYNDKFFPDASYKKLPNVFESYDSMVDALPETIKSLDSERIYGQTNKNTFEKLSKIYSRSAYRKNIAELYKGNLDYLPSRDSVMHLVSAVVTHKQVAINGESEQVAHLNKVINDHVSERKKLLVQLDNLKAELLKANDFIKKVQSIPGYSVIERARSIHRHLKKR